MAQAAFVFDCPTKAYDLSSNDWLTVQMKREFDNWFEEHHEIPAKAPNDEEFFEKLLTSHGPNNENSNVAANVTNYTSKDKARKRSIGEVNGLSSTALSKPLRNPQIPSSSSLGRATKIARPNPSSASAVTKTNAIISSRASSESIPLISSGRTAGSITSRVKSNGPTSIVADNKSSVSRQIQPANKLRSVSASKQRNVPTSATVSKAPCLKKKNSKEDDESLEQLLKAHNSKFVPVPAYEPPKHSVRDVRKWEKMTGRLWCELKPEERQAANDEISRLKDNNEFN